MDPNVISFDFLHVLNSTTPPERRGIRRDFVKLMVLNKQTGETEHSTFNQLKHFLQKCDLLVLNSSRTVPAILKVSWIRNNQLLCSQLEVRLAHRHNDTEWEALLLDSGVEIGDILQFSAFMSAEVVGASSTNPFHRLLFNISGARQMEQIYKLGQPVRYEYIEVPWELDYYQTVFASEPGSVEMPSAGRAFSWELIFELQRQGIQIAYVQLHTGLSYLMDDKWHQEPFHNYEQYNVPEETTNLVNRTKAAGGRVIEVGTTVVRSLESSVGPCGESIAQKGWTNLYIHDHYQLKLVDGLITGFHEPRTSHLQLLSAFVSEDLLMKSYHEALDHGYYWHEFGDMNLII
jgi:S-adenosylmethionine:tRNA ribosyltransferase-isomerase